MKTRIFRRYLSEKGLSEHTIQKMFRSVKRFEAWQEQQEQTLTGVKHPTVIAYINYMRTTLKYLPVTMNGNLSDLKYYYRCLNTKNNPFEQVWVRGERKTVNTGGLSGQQLEELYHALPQGNKLQTRSKVLAGLYIFQGLSTTDVLAVHTGDFDLDHGKVYIPATTRRNQRLLQLHPAQLFLLVKALPMEKPRELLYQSLSAAKQDKWIFKHLDKQLQLQPAYKSLRHLRYSVILNWLKVHNLRFVQHYAGHRYITSTEKYLKNDVSDLKAAIVDRHPLNR